VPVHLRRAPIEARNAGIVAFYDSLLAALRTDAFGDGAWSLIAPQSAWDGNPTWQDFICYAWHTTANGRFVVVVNYSDHQGQCRLRLPFDDLAGRQFQLTDVMGSEVYWRDGGELMEPGLYIDLGAWRFNVFRLDPA
jgi:hypothetical protein